jgi:DNA integrity scanning protein DisA with diadenylate cyclase activity
MSPTKESMTREEYNAYMRDYRKRAKADLRTKAEESFQQKILKSALEFENQGLRSMIAYMQVSQFRDKPVQEQDTRIRNTLDILKQQVQGFICDISNKLQEEITAAEMDLDKMMNELEPRLFQEYQKSMSVPGVLPEVAPDWESYIKRMDVFKRDGYIT